MAMLAGAMKIDTSQQHIDPNRLQSVYILQGT